MFVHWHDSPELDVFDAIPLRDALHRHNPNNALMIVEEATSGEQAGSVAMVAQGLYRGTIEKFAPRANVPTLEHRQWGRLCANALALWQPGEA